MITGRVLLAVPLKYTEAAGTGQNWVFEVAVLPGASRRLDCQHYRHRHSRSQRGPVLCWALLFSLDLTHPNPRMLL